MILLISKNKAAAGAKVAGAIAAFLREKPDGVLGLVTGNSVIDAFALLSEKEGPYAVDWSKAKVFLLDEFADLPKNDPHSCLSFVKTHLLDNVNIDPANVHVPNGTGDLDQEAIDYEKAIKDAGGIGFQLLGLGVNGHLGGNEPGTQFNSRTRTTSLAEGSKDILAKEFGERRLVPSRAITLGLANICEAKKVVLIATGASKAKAIAGLFEGEAGPELPCSCLRKHPDTTIIVDKEAASQMTKKLMTTLTHRAVYRF